MRSHTLVPLIVVALVTACGDGESNHLSAGLADIGGGRKMYVECAGAGTPTVVLIAGKGNRADTWSTSLVQPAQCRRHGVSPDRRFTRVCAYDRPLTSASTARRAAVAGCPSL